MADEIDPSEFVQRIRQLGEQRDQQDAERVKKLEEDLLQGRSERLARRAGESAHPVVVVVPLVDSTPCPLAIADVLLQQNEPAQFPPTSRRRPNRCTP